MSLAIRVIPCLDVREDRVVKGTRFADLRDVGDPVALARRYAHEGADELVVLDIAATLQARAHRRELVARIRQVLDIPLCVGGGVAATDDARELLEAGADKVAINSAAVARPGLIDEMAQAFGVQCTVVAIDARRVSVREDAARLAVLTHAGSRDAGLDAGAWAAECERRGAGEILLTSWDRDGTGAGYDEPLLRHVRRATALPIIASGGAASVDDLPAAARAGADAVLAAGMFHSGRESVGAAHAALAAAGLEVRS